MLGVTMSLQLHVRHHGLVSWETGDDDLNLTTATDTKVEGKAEDYTWLFHHCLKLLLLGGISIFSCDSAMTLKLLEDQRTVFNPVCSLCS